MTGVSFDYDEATTIVLPGAERPTDVSAWAASAVERWASAHDLPAEKASTLRRALARAQQTAATDPSTNLLLLDPGTGVVAPLRLTLLGRPLTEEEQRRYLWPASVTRPQLRRHVAPALGPGWSSTVLEDAERATVRWLHAPVGATFFSVLGPLPAPAVLASAVRVEEILESLRLDGVAPGDGTALVAHVAGEPAADGAWAV